MSKQYPGGIITKNPVVPSGPYETSTASGIWTLDQQAYWKKLGQWPIPGNVAPDPQFNYVTMLLHGDGTNGAQNNTFLDSSTNAFTITRNGNTTQGSFSPYGSNWSNFFDGSGDWLSTASTSALAFGTGDFTLEAWVYPLENQTGFRGILSAYDGAGPVIETNGNYWAYYFVSSGVTTTTLVVPNVWTHVALTRSGTTGRMFVNGVIAATVSDSTNYSTNSTVTVGTLGGGLDAGYEFKGYISNTRIVAGTAVYTSDFTPPTAPLTAISGTAFLSCQSNRFVDNSTNNFAITVNGTPSVQRFNPFGASTAYSTSVIGGSGYFDGDGDYLQATAGAVPAIGTSDFTISGWWYLNELKNFQILFDFRNGSNSEAVPYVYVTSSGAADYYVSGTSHNFSSTLKANQWFYMVISRVSGTTKVFVNGSEVVSYSDSVTYVAGRLTLGVNNGGGGTNYFYNGYISDFKVVIGTGTTSGTPTTSPATATSGTQALLSMQNGAIFDNAMMNNLETVGNAQISTSVVKYGTGSLYINGSGNALISAPSPNNILGGGDFTIEFWLYPSNTSAGYRALVSSENYSATTGGWSLYQNGTTIEFWISSGNIFQYSSAITASTWQHLALSRASGTLRLFINGTQVTSVSNSTSLTGQQIWIGDNNAGSYFYEGYLDDLRITKGFARYTANFTPPTAAFPNTGPN